MGQGNSTCADWLTLRLDKQQCAAAAAAVFSGAVILYATRSDPMLSPDSISYLSTAAHLRSGDGFTQFTGEPLTVFGPIMPILLAAGGRSLLWARLVGASAIAIATWLMYILLKRRVHPWVAVVAAAAFGTSQGVVRVGSFVWSEAPYLCIVLAALVVLTGAPLNQRRCAVGGLLCGLGFLTRYAGAGLVVTGMVCVVAASYHLGRAQALRMTGTFFAAATATGGIWVVRNLIETGEALGPRFSGGAADSFEELIRKPIKSLSELIFGDLVDPSRRTTMGLVVLGVLLACAIIALARHSSLTLDLAMLTLAATSLVIPVAARWRTASDIDFRVMSPMLIPVIYVAAAALNRLRAQPVALIIALSAVLWSANEGTSLAQRTPQYLSASVGSRTQYAPALYDLVEALPERAHVLTNSPQRVWWHTDRNPTQFAFTRPRAGNSNYPLSPADTLALACTPDTYLAWFGQLQNAGDGPTERRPDLVKIIDLTLEETVAGGELYLLTAHDSSTCND